MKQTPDLRRPSTLANREELTPFRMARKWLGALARSTCHDNNPRPETFCRILLGCWICNSVLGLSGSEFTKTARLIGAALEVRKRRRGLDWSQTPPPLRLITASLLASRCVNVRFLHGKAGYVRQAQSMFQGLSNSELEDGVEFYESRLLLYRLGLVPKPQAIGIHEVLRFAEVLPLTDPGPGIAHLLCLISCATEAGSKAVDLPAEASWLKDVLPGLAAAAFRRYDLISGCRLLRAAHHLAIGCEVLDSCLAFLQLHQRPEGPFGFHLSEERNLLEKMNKGHSPLFLETALDLPATVECLWTLAETATSWRLWQSIP